MTETRHGLKASATPSHHPPGVRPETLRRPSRRFRQRLTQQPSAARFRDLAVIACFLRGNQPAARRAELFPRFRLRARGKPGSSPPPPKLELRPTSLAEIPVKFEAFFNDNFGFRKRLIHWLNAVKVSALGVSPSPKVVLGRNDWLFYGDLDIPYYRAVKPLTVAQLEAWRMQLEERREWLAAREIRYLIVFTPLKSTIYPEFMPPAYNRVGAESRLDQLVAHLKAHSNLTVIDLRAPLLAEKARHQIYYRTDTHWNDRGAYIGYQEIMRALRRWLPDLHSIPASAFAESEHSGPGRDLALILGMRSYFSDRYVDLTMIAKPLAHQVQPGPPPGKLSSAGP